MTLRLDITCDLDQIVARFRKGTRYEVKRAERIGITVRRAADGSGLFCVFYQIHNTTCSRHKGFAALPIEDFTALSERMRAAPERGALFLSEYRGRHSCWRCLIAGRTAGSLRLRGDRCGQRRQPSGRCIRSMCRAIAWAKEIGCTEFDFGGYGPSGVYVGAPVQGGVRRRSPMPSRPHTV